MNRLMISLDERMLAFSQPKRIRLMVGLDERIRLMADLDERIRWMKG